MSPDFYAKIFINGVETQTNREPDDRLKVEPSGWTASVTVDDAVTPMVPVTIQIWDHDSTSGDDLGDASPQSDHNNLDLVVNLANGGFWSGDLDLLRDGRRCRYGRRRILSDEGLLRHHRRHRPGR